ATSFTFNGTMSKEVLRSYCSRAVSHAGLCIESMDINPIFEEDLRMLTNIGAKYIGRAAYYSWAGNLTTAQIEEHFRVAKERATRAHQVDPEMILQAGVFEIAYRGAVESCKIPAHVFEAFGQKVENRNFRFESIVFPKGTKDVKGTNTGIGCWGTGDDGGVPDITQLETKMYFYYQICRYIDAGYEAFHMGQAEKMMLYRGNGYAYHWKELLDKARAYAKTHARRGIVLFDYHDDIGSKGIMVGDELVFDIVGAGIVPNETGMQDAAFTCEITHYSDCWLSWIGRSGGGKHPLGFDIDECFTILEFDNYGGNGNPGVPTYDAFYNWGFDDVTWFATQPEWYRNLFLLECDAYLSNSQKCLDSEEKQQYFLQPSCKRVITPGEELYPLIDYTPGKNASKTFIENYIKSENMDYYYDKETNTYTLSVRKDYRANRQSDACPNGFNQEDTIKQIFLGIKAPEPSTTSQPTATTSKPNQTVGTASKPSENTTSNADSAIGNNASNGATVSSIQSGSAVGSGETVSIVEDGETTDQSDQTLSNAETSSTLSTDGNAPDNGWIIWLIIGIAAVLLIGGGVVAFYFLYYKKKKGVNKL
ncbi:MAG: hypothetical protein IJD11_03700, partial [Oscillospiraceae bacterium]|nr:hypothetical protein [Oscillospiraceae bacterium]